MAPHTVAPSTIRVRLFARYAELLGQDDLTVPAEGLSTAGDVLARIRSLPGGHEIAESTLMAINLRQAGLDAPVAPGDEVAFLPPLAGG
jgi:molybdopterin synthase sulfur carrier subunit